MEDFFGVVHEKVKKPSAAKASSGQTYADEKEFEKEMLTSEFAPERVGTLTAVEDDDDEFDFQDGRTDTTTEQLRLLLSESAEKPSSSAQVPIVLPSQRHEFGTIAEEDEEAHEEQEDREEAAKARDQRLREEEERRVAQEWLEVERDLKDVSAGGGEAEILASGRREEDIIKATELQEYVRSKQVDWQRMDIEPYREPEDTSFFSVFCSCMTVPPELDFPGAEAQRNLPFLLAKVDYDPALEAHQRALKTVYTKLTGEDCPGLNGAHWERIGFQGSDPCMDLNRSLGILSVLQCLRFLEKRRILAKRVYLDSDTRTRQWPFMLVSINFTKRALEALRSGTLYPECNKRRTVMDVLDDVHHAMFQYFYDKLGRQPHESQFKVLNQTYAECPRGCLRMLQEYKKAKSQPKTLQTAAELEPESFADIRDARVVAGKAAEGASSLDARLQPYAI